MYLISYGYAVHMMSIEPDRDLWGYICVLIFAILAMAGVNEFVNHVDKEKKDKE